MSNMMSLVLKSSATSFDGRSEVMVRVTNWFQNEACLSSDARSTLQKDVEPELKSPLPDQHGNSIDSSNAACDA